MNIKLLYKHLMLEKECVESRSKCSKQCSDCELCPDILERHDAILEIAELLKARDPELYFANQLSDLESLITQGGIRK